MTLDEMAEEDWQRYLKTWKVVCRKLLGWSETQTEEWATKYRALELLAHDPPCLYVAYELIPKEFRSKLKYLAKFAGVVEGAIERPVHNCVTDMVSRRGCFF